MSQTKKLIDTLKRVMKARGLTYSALATRLEVSEPTVKRALTEEDSLSMKRLEAICQIVGISFSELVRLADLHLDERPNALTDEQEEILSLELNLFKVFYLLLRQWELTEIEEHFHVQKLDLEKALLQLDKMKLIEYHAGGKVKLLVNRNIRWKKNGPIYKIFEQEMKHKFLARTFNRINEKFTLLTGTLSQASQIVIKDKMSRFEREIEEIIEMDLYVDKDETESVAIVLALGPINLAIFEG